MLVFVTLLSPFLCLSANFVLCMCQKDFLHVAWPRSVTICFRYSFVSLELLLSLVLFWNSDVGILTTYTFLRTGIYIEEFPLALLCKFFVVKTDDIQVSAKLDWTNVEVSS